MRVGIVGLGFMGRMHYRCWKAVPGVELVAVCEANPQVLAAAGASSEGNIGGAAEAIDLDALEVFSDLDALIRSNLVDAISITLPTFLHADSTIKALEAGLHVLCEKPMALNLDDCDRMVAAAESTGRVLQIGHCIRFWPEYVVARELVLGGTYGAVVAASFRRYTAQPAWSADSWFADEARSGGQPLDLHVHDSDYIHYLFGMPGSVTSAGDHALSAISTQYHYPGGPVITAESNWRMSSSFGFEMSFNIMLERATLQYDLTRPTPFRVCPHDGDAFTPDVPPGDGYSREIEHFARIASGEPIEPVVTPQQSRDTIRLVLAEKQSAREVRRVELGP